MNKPTIIAIANKKGGVAKTTTALNLGAGLHRLGKKVMLVDLDEQCNLSGYLGYRPGAGQTMSELIYAEVAHQPVDIESLIQTNAEGLDYIASSNMLATTTSILGNDNDSGSVLRRIFSKGRFQSYDYIILDCRPSLDLLVVNALVASDQFIVPMQPEPFAVEGIVGIMDTFQRVRATQNPSLELGGILITLVDTRTNMAREVEQLLRSRFGDKVFRTTIPRLAEAPNSTSEQCSLVQTKNSRLGERYLAMAEELING